MYIVDDICYAGRPSSNIRIVDAKPLLGGMLLCMFSSGEKKLFDTTSLTEPVFLPLQDETVFSNLKVEHGFVSWNNGEIDIAPEYIYEHGLQFEETDDIVCA